MLETTNIEASYRLEVLSGNAINVGLSINCHNCKDRERKRIYGCTIENGQIIIYLDFRKISNGRFWEYGKVHVTLDINE